MTDTTPSVRPAAYEGLPTLSLADDAFWREPAVAARGCLDHGHDAAWVPDLATIALLRYDDCHAGLLDPDLGAMGDRYFRLQGWTDGAFLDWIRTNIVMMDPPDHDRLRALVNRAFTPNKVEAMRAVAQRVAGDLCDEALDAGEVEFVHDWARLLPLRVICEMLGVPHVDHELMGEWAAGLSAASGPATEEARRLGNGAMEAFSSYVGDLIAERRRDPRDDLLTALIRAEAGGQRLSEAELVAMVVQLLFAGHETTQGLIANALFRLLESPDQLARLRHDRDLIANTVEESLRYDPPILFVSRIARRPMTLAGLPVEADQMVVLHATSANHDPRRWDHPERFLVDRPEIRHLSFSFGLHYCLGANLARLEGQVALDVVLDRFETIEPTGEAADWKTFTPLRTRERMPLNVRGRA